MLTLYLRKETSTERLAPPGEFDVVAYRDKEATDRLCRWAWHRKKPDGRNRYVTVNCYRYKIEWLPILLAQPLYSLQKARAGLASAVAELDNALQHIDGPPGTAHDVRRRALAALDHLDTLL